MTTEDADGFPRKLANDGWIQSLDERAALRYVRNTGNRQSLPATEKHFGGQMTDGSRNQRDYDSAKVFENSISGQDNDGSATHG
jgi:hypothetical protein